MKLYWRVKIEGKWTYKAVKTVEECEDYLHELGTMNAVRNGIIGDKNEL